MRALAAATLALVATACGEELRSPSRVDALRVIALVTETPEVRPDGGAEVRAVWFDPAGRAPEFAWRLCWERAGVDPLSCADDPAAQAIASVGEVATVGPALLRGRASDVAIVLVRLRAGDDRVEAFRRITVRADGALNRPPAIASVALLAGTTRVTVEEGATVEVPAAGLRVEVTPADDARELRPDGARELLTASFLAGAGAFDPPRALGEGALRASWRDGAAGSVRMWAVLRDDRGGASVRAWTARVTR